jgi:hypothetical protein
VPITILRARSAATYLSLAETAGSRDLSGRHFLAAKKPAVAARKIGAPILPSVRLNAITCG